MVLNANAVANYFIDLAKQDAEFITPIQLQKLIYFAHGFYLAKYNSPLINELFIAWAYGPVVNSVYHEFKRFGRGGITEYAEEWDDQTAQWIISDFPRDNEIPQFLSNIWAILKGYTGIQLSNVTHLPKSPWSTVVNEWGGVRYLPKGISISNRLIRTYFRSRM